MRPFMFGLALVAVMATTGCKKKDPEVAADPTPAAEPGAPVFVDLGDEDEDEEDMMGSELMQATAECGNLRRLEPAAMMGKLSDGEIRCLSKTLNDSDRQTHKDKLSRVLMADAYAKKNDDRWEAIVRRHLTDIDRSDPDLCYKFSIFMSKKGPKSADEVMKWADVALENKHIWDGPQYVKRVSSLYKIKAVSALKKWQWMEEEFLKTPSEDLGGGKEDARNQAKTLAREWLGYLKSASLDQDKAMQVCVMAAGTDQFCQI
jgi:hypothetical protein